MAQLSLPISPAPEVDLASQAASLDRLVLPTKLTESGGMNESRDRGGKGLFINDVITFGGYRDPSPPPPPCHL